MNRDISESISSLADSQYDVIQREDFSDHDNDADTASIASTTRDDDDFDELLEDGRLPTLLDGLDQVASSFDDLTDTPRQSIVTPLQPHPIIPSSRNDIIRTTIDRVQEEPLEQAQRLSDMAPEQVQKGTRSNKTSPELLSTLKKSVTGLTLLLLVGLQLLRYFNLPPILTEHAIQREALAASLAKATNTTDASRIFDLDHLLPQPRLTNNGIWGLVHNTYETQKDVRFQAVSPNRFILSLPATSSFYAPRLQSVNVHRGGQGLSFNQTQLVTGIYDVVFDVEHAYGMVSVDMVMKHSVPQSSASHNFGSRMLQRHTYEKATTDLSKSVGEHSIIARKAAQSVTEWLQIELYASAAAARELTTQLAVCVPPHLQAMADEVKRVSKDLIVAEQKGLVLLGDGIKRTAKAFVPARKLVKSHLGMGIRRSKALKEKLLNSGRAMLSNAAHKKEMMRRRSISKYGAARQAEHDAERAAREAVSDARQAARKTIHEAKRAARKAVGEAKEASRRASLRD